MKIIQVDPGDRRLKKQFLELPFRLYRDTPQWVPPLEMDARSVWDVRKHAFYRHGEAAFLLALDDQECAVGRLAVLNNHAYNEFNREKSAIFYTFECENNPQAAGGLFEAAAAWARARHLDRIIGPKGFTPLDGLGMLVKGFEHRPAFGQLYNPAYYPALLEGAGFTQLDADIVSGYLNPSTFVNIEKIKRVAELVEKRKGITVKRFKNKREFSLFIPKLMDLYNASLGDMDGGYPLSPEDVKTMSNQLLWLADPRLIKFIMKEDQVIGFLLAYPDISAALQRSQGRLLPFGWWYMLRESKHTSWVNINGAAILEQYRGQGGTALLFNAMYESILEGGFEHAEAVQIAANNDPMQAELRNLGIDFYKVHRLYKMKV